MSIKRPKDDARASATHDSNIAEAAIRSERAEESLSKSGDFSRCQSVASRSDAIEITLMVNFAMKSTKG